MSKSVDNSSMWLIVFVVIGFATLLQLLSGNSGDSGGSSSATYSTPNTAEHRYVRERFRQEGFSDSDSETAARAVMKFHQAQQRRAQ